MEMILHAVPKFPTEKFLTSGGQIQLVLGSLVSEHQHGPTVRWDGLAPSKQGYGPFVVLLP